MILVERDWLDPETQAQLVAKWEKTHAPGTSLPRGVSDEGVYPAYKDRQDWFLRRGSVLDAALTNRLGRLVTGKRWAPAVWETERWRVGGYAAPSGHFALHRDDDGPAVANRVLAVVVGLLGTYAGGVLTLPELGVAVTVSAGQIVLFSARHLHGVTPVTDGRRMVLVNFIRGL